MSSVTSGPRRAAFIGLGTMGYPMAGHLAEAGFDVCVYNRTAAKAARWAGEHRGRTAATPAEAARGADAVFCCVGNDNDLRSVVLGETGALAGMKPGAFFVDHTTASAAVERELAAEAAKKGIHWIDAPVSGGQSGAEKGVLTVLCGGSAEDVAAVRPMLDAYSSAVTLLGPVGSGQLAKMVNQICIAGCVEGLSEAIAFGMNAGLDMHAVLGAIGKGAASSWQMLNRGDTMVEGKFDFGFAVDWMRKDLGIVMDEAKRNGSALPVTEMVDRFYAEVQKMGGSRWDTSSLIARLPKPRS
jgi:3-hydroxyisobutyrate dehydrogenase